MVTPVILTFDERENIDLTLSTLQWARDVVVVDSGSSDGTRQIAEQFRNVRVFTRPFDSHAAQWRYAIYETGVTTPYVLCLDADMRVPDRFVGELQGALSSQTVNGAWVAFKYRLCGKDLRGSLYPDQMRCFRPSEVEITQHGHTQVFNATAPTCRISTPLVHEDLKSLERTLRNQEKYAVLEADRILSTANLGWKDKARLAGISPCLAGIFGYVRAGGPLTGNASRAYGLERMLFESILARQLIARSTRNATDQFRA